MDYLKKYLSEEEFARVKASRQASTTQDTTATPQAPPQEKVAVEVSPGILGYAGDLISGLKRAPVDAAQNAVHGLIDVAETVLNPVVDVSQGAENLRSMTSFASKEQQTTGLGNAARNVGRFLAGFVGVGQIKAIKALNTAAKGSTVGTIAAAATQGAVADAIVSDPYESRLSDLVQSVPALQNPVTEYLASDPTDGRVEGRFKAAAEGILPGVAVDSLLTGLRAFRAWKRGEVSAEQAADVVRGAIAEPAVEGEKIAPVKFLGEQARPGGKPSIELWNLTEDVNENLVKGSTVSRETLEKAGFTVPPRPGEMPKLKVLSDEAHTAFRERVRSSINGEGADEPLEGVLNYTKMDSPDAVKRTLSDMAVVANDELKHIGGTYRSLDATKELADTLGEDFAVVRGRLAGLAKSADEVDGLVVAGKTWVQSLSRDVTSLAKKIEGGLGTAQDEIELLRRTDILADLMDHLSAVQTGAARATSAGRIRTMDAVSPQQIKEALDAAGGSDSLKSLANRIAMANGDARAIKATIDAGPVEKALAVHNFMWINGILSGVKTHVVNAVTSVANSLFLPAARITGGGAEWAWQAARGADTTVAKRQMVEGMYQYAALRHTVFDSLDMARRAFQTNASILDPGNAPQGIVAPLSSEYLGINNTAIAWGVDWLGRIAGISGRMLTTSDEFFKQINYRSHVMASAWADGMERNLSGDALETFVKGRIRSSVDEMGKALDNQALAMAQEATFTQSLKTDAFIKYRGQSLGAVVAEAAGHPILRGTVMPFVKVPTNIFRQLMDMGPTAVLRKEFYSDVAAGGEARAMALGKLGLGSSLWAGAAMLAMEGKITGGGPRDPDLQRTMRSSGWQPYSFVFDNADGTKSYLSFTRLEPFGYFFSLAGDFAEIAAKADQGIVDDLASSMTLALSRNLSSKTYLRGIVDFASMLGSGVGADEAAQRYVRNWVASHVPSGLALLNGDDELKNVRTMMDAVKARVPGLSQSVEARRDNFGQKFIAPMGYPYSAVNPFTFTTTKDDSVRQELMRLGNTASEARFTLPPEKLNGRIDLTQIRNAEGQTAYDRWLELHGEHKVNGKTLYENLAGLFESDTYKRAVERMGDGSAVYRGSLAVDLVQQKVEMYRKLTLQKLQSEYPELRQAVNDFRVNSARTRVKGPGVATFNELISR